jgi:membrane protein
MSPAFFERHLPGESAGGEVAACLGPAFQGDIIIGQASASRARPQKFWQALKRAIDQFSSDNALSLAAALSFYLVLSLAPLVVVTLSVAGLVWGQQAASREMVTQVQKFVGTSGAEAIQSIIAHANQPRRGTIALILGIIAALFGATGVFVQLQYSLDTIWNVKPNPDRGIIGVFWDRLISLVMVLLIGVLLLAMLVFSAVLTTVNTHLRSVVPSAGWQWQIVDFLVSLAVVTLLFAVIFKFLPHVRIRWRRVWLGAFLTGLLFTIGKFLIGIYLGYSGVGSAYGAAGSLVVVLVWVYYSSLILFFGAELTQVHAQAAGERIEPSRDAVPADAGL